MVERSECEECPARMFKLFDYDVMIEIFERTNNNKIEEHESLWIKISYKTATETKFIDEFIISHKHRTFLLQVIQTIYACFSKQAIDHGFIKYDDDINLFQFRFQSKARKQQRSLSTLRKISLSKEKYTKNEAIQKIKHYNHNNVLSVQCINSHQIFDVEWELEVKLNVPTGVHQFFAADLFEEAINIYIRDYIRIRDFYMDKLKEVYQKYKMFRLYLNYIHYEKDVFLIWTKLGIETGKLINLCFILNQIKNDDDSIWMDLFDLCWMDNYETDDGQNILINNVDEQSVADFIALSIKYYCLDSKILTHCNKYYLSKAVTYCDKYLLSIVLPYFDIKGIKNKEEIYDKQIKNVMLMSGLFNEYVNFNKDEYEIDIDVKRLKSDLLFNLNRMKPSIDVIKHSWRYRQHQEYDWHFTVFGYLRHKIEKYGLPIPDDIINVIVTFYRPIMDHTNHAFEYTLTETVERNENNTQILNCYDTTYEYDWVMWTNKGLKRLYQTSKGYWKILNEYIEHPRIPIKHLDSMRMLINSIDNDYSNGGILVHLHDVNDNTKLAEYLINIWHINKSPVSTTTLSIRIIKAFDPVIDRKSKIKSRDSHFLYFKPTGNVDGKGIVEWNWYNNDQGKYEEYRLGENVTKQMEAAYQGVQEYNFPLTEYYRNWTNMEPLFTDPQLTELSNDMVSIVRLPFKPRILRFTFDASKNNNSHNEQKSHCLTNVINMEQVDININGYDQRPWNVRRRQTVPNDNVIIDEYRIYLLGKMDINILNDNILINWTFEKDDKFGIDKPYYFNCLINQSKRNKNEYIDLLKNILVLWRNNDLFHQHQSSIICSDIDKTKLNISNILIRKTEINTCIGKIFKMENICYYISWIETDEETVKCSQISDEKQIDFPDELILHINQLQHVEFVKDDIYTKRIMNEQDSNYYTKQIPSRYQEILNNQLMTGINDKNWLELDEMDDGIADNFHHDGKLINIFSKYHKRERFNDKIYSLVSLKIIQSIISMMKEHIDDHTMNDDFDSNPFIIAISNEWSLFDYKNDNKYISKFNKSYQTLFDQTSFIKRIDCKNNIFDIKIPNFIQDICNKNLLHDFMAISSKIYASTLFLFKRPRSKNIYISHNGYIRKLSLKIYNEDLYYFLPSFITLQIGDFVDIESCSYRDCGTIINYFKSKQPKHSGMIYYKIRSSQNVFYHLNYYQITNRLLPKIYFTQCRASLIPNNQFRKLSLCNNSMNINCDPSDTSHPLHIISLSLIESTKQSILAINSDKNIDVNDIQNKLKQCGIIYLLYRTVKNAPKSADIQELLKEQKHPELLNNFERSESYHKDRRGLDKLIENLEKEKLISNKRRINECMTYNNLMKLNEGILRSNTNNKIYIIHIEEERELYGVMDKLRSERDIELMPLKIKMRSTFKCKIEYEYKMSRVYSMTKTVQHLIEKYRNISMNKWTEDENKLLTFLYNNMVYNEYDLNDRNIVNKLRTVLQENCKEPHFRKLSKKFEEFIKKKNNDKKDNKSYLNWMNNSIIDRIEITRNAILLKQEYIDNVKEKQNRINNTMVIAYNPLQSSIITSNSAKDITHPIDIYRSAYSSDLSNFYNDFELNSLYNGWMKEPFFPKTVDKLYQQKESMRSSANIINAISRIFIYSRRYEIVLVPSSIYLKESFLRDECNPIAPEYDAIKVGLIFIYNGMLYKYSKNDQDYYRWRGIKVLIKTIKQNIVENGVDCMEPIYMIDNNKLRLRNIIKRNNKDTMITWLEIGNGHCSINEPSGKQIDRIELPKSSDYDNDLPDLLRRAMFMHCIDCKIPHNINNKALGDNICDLCANYMINPCKMDTCNEHHFCKKCIDHWISMKRKFDPNKVKSADSKDIYWTIPMYKKCHAEIGSIEIDEKYNNKYNIDKILPMTICEQLLKEHNIRFERLNLLNRYQQKT